MNPTPPSPVKKKPTRPLSAAACRSTFNKYAAEKTAASAGGKVIGRRKRTASTATPGPGHYQNIDQAKRLIYQRSPRPNFSRGSSRGLRAQKLAEKYLKGN